jgi:hypothetical protein
MSPAADDSAGHPLRRTLPPAEPIVPGRTKAQEDVAFFLISFASAFIILYGFII